MVEQKQNQTPSSKGVIGGALAGQEAIAQTLKQLYDTSVKTLNLFCATKLNKVDAKLDNDTGYFIITYYFEIEKHTFIPSGATIDYGFIRSISICNELEVKFILKEKQLNEQINEIKQYIEFWRSSK